MKKCFCDACEKEIISSNGGTSCPVKVHLLDNNGINNMYIDRDFNPVSGRFENLDLCNACYNKIMGAAVAKLVEIQGNRPSEQEK
jgi:hypothetical protein